MFNVSSPWLLLGLLSILIPIIIHLFNKSRGQLVKVGSIELVRNLKNSQVKQVKLMRWLLLVIRILIFTLVTLIIAEIWFKHAPSKKHKSEVLVSQSWLNAATNNDINTLFDIHKGDNIALLNNTHLKLTKQYWQQTLASTTNIQKTSKKVTMPTSPETLWPIIYNNIKQLNSNRPLHVYMTNANTISSFNELSLTKVSVNQLGFVLENQDIKWHIKNVNLNHTIASDILKETKIQVAIYHQLDRNAKPLKLALETLKQFQWPNMSITLLTKAQLLAIADNKTKVASHNDKDNSDEPDSAIGKNSLTEIMATEAPDILFYLSDEPIIESIQTQLKQGMVLIKDADLSALDAHLPAELAELKSGQYTVASLTPLLGKSTVSRYIKARSNIELPVTENSKIPPTGVWALNNGDNLLSVTSIGRGKYLQFSSRFQHDWFPSVNNAEFVSIIALLLSHHQDVRQYQRYYVSPSQLELTQTEDISLNPDLATIQGNQAINTSNIKKLKQYSFHFLAMFVLLLWIIERVLSERYYRAEY